MTMVSEWSCWICGHFAGDYEEQGALGPEHHMRVKHGLNDNDALEADMVCGEMAAHRILPGAMGLRISPIHLPDEQQWDAVALASQVNYMGVDGLTDGASAKDTEEVIQDIVAGRRLPNALEALNFTFYIGNVSRTMTHQLVRTRIGAVFLQLSSRDTDLRDAYFRMPITIFGDKRMRSHFLAKVSQARASYEKAVDDGIPLQDARFMLTEAVCSNLTASYNWPALRDVMGKRLQNHMQWEINAVMRNMRQLIRTYKPEIAKLLYPVCERTKVCQLATDTMSPCGKFPNPYEGKLKWRVPREMNPHGYRFNMERFLNG